MIRISFALTLILSLFLSCREKSKGNFTVTGSFKNADKLAMSEGPISKVLLLEVPAGKDQSPIVLDSAVLSGNRGNFTLSGMGKSQEVYELVFGNSALVVPVIDDASEIKVDIDLGKGDDFYEVSGSEGSNQLKELLDVFGKKNFEVEKATMYVDSLQKSNTPDSIVLLAKTKESNIIQDLNAHLQQFINTNNNPTICAMALSWASRTFSKADFESALGSLLRKFPENAPLKSIKESYDQQLAQMAEREQREKDNSWVGKQAPDLALPDVNGTPIALHSFKGKYVLVDFWASWCGPCRQENPNVVKAYNEFKNKNFTILGVSLDKDKDAWQQAIQTDQLTWTHVSDLKFWNSKAVDTFKFEGIPFNILIDPQGKIIAESLRGDELENKLKQVLN
jgi:peroxiredoxin